MSVKKEIFYNLFWQNKAAQNLFLLSKEEFLDTKTITVEGNSTSVSFPRIILSNIQSKEGYIFDKMKIRTETQNITRESLINQTIEKYSPILNNFLETKFGKSIQVFLKDLESNFIEMFVPLIFSLAEGEKEFEKNCIELLQKYGFIGKQVNSFSELEAYFQKEAIDKNFKNIVSEQNLINMLELLKCVKDIYVNEVYKGLYNSNQVLVNSYHDIDNFEDRLNLFSILYESDIIRGSSEDSIIECMNCSPGTYKGVFQLKIDPRKLNDLKCPNCNSKLTFHVPYELDKSIYEIVKSKDGLILDALLVKLNNGKFPYSINQTFLNDIEIDCITKIKDVTYIIECKMYKKNNTASKLESKLKEHFSKLIEDITRIIESGQYKNEKIMPILLVNINDFELINRVMTEIKVNNPDKLFQKGVILTIDKV